MLIPVMFSFFTMGFVDLVGIATNYVKADFHLSDTLANLLPSMVFFWFLIFSVPTGMLMNKIGQRKTVLLSIVVTVAALDQLFICQYADFLLLAGNRKYADASIIEPASVEYRHRKPPGK